MIINNTTTVQWHIILLVGASLLLGSLGCEDPHQYSQRPWDKEVPPKQEKILPVEKNWVEHVNHYELGKGSDQYFFNEVVLMGDIPNQNQKIALTLFETEEVGQKFVWTQYSTNGSEPPPEKTNYDGDWQIVPETSAQGDLPKKDSHLKLTFKRNLENPQDVQRVELINYDKNQTTLYHWGTISLQSTEVLAREIQTLVPRCRDNIVEGSKFLYANQQRLKDQSLSTEEKAKSLSCVDFSKNYILELKKNAKLFTDSKAAAGECLKIRKANKKFIDDCRI